MRRPGHLGSSPLAQSGQRRRRRELSAVMMLVSGRLSSDEPSFPGLTRCLPCRVRIEGFKDGPATDLVLARVTLYLNTPYYWSGRAPSTQTAAAARKAQVRRHAPKTSICIHGEYQSWGAVAAYIRIHGSSHVGLLSNCLVWQWPGSNECGAINTKSRDLASPSFLKFL